MTLQVREIQAQDVATVANLLSRGFPYDSAFWSHFLQCLEKHPTPPSLPKYGYCLCVNQMLVGVVLLIFTLIDGKLRCNVSSWYVEPLYRSYAPILARRATGRKDTTYFNISPAPHTWAILERQGFCQYAEERFAGVPALCPSSGRVRIVAFAPHMQADETILKFEIDVLRDHSALGSLCLICVDMDERFPFVFHPYRAKRIVPSARLVYCRSLSSYTKFAGALGRYLLLRGIVVVTVESNTPIRGMIGRSTKGVRRYWKGPYPMRLGDSAYSETMFL